MGDRPQFWGICLYTVSCSGEILNGCCEFFASESAFYSDD
jgi:hypothetical protein